MTEFDDLKSIALADARSVEEKRVQELSRRRRNNLSFLDARLGEIFPGAYFPKPYPLDDSTYKFGWAPLRSKYTLQVATDPDMPELTDGLNGVILTTPCAWLMLYHQSIGTVRRPADLEEALR